MLAPSASIGAYRILTRIGEGGMGAVYLAEHTLLGLDGMGRKAVHFRRVGQRRFAAAGFLEICRRAASWFFHRIDHGASRP